MVDAYYSPQTADLIATAKARLFATSKLQGKEEGRTISLVLWRDEDAAPPAGAVGPQDVLVIFGGGRPGVATTRRGDAIQVTNQHGELRKEPPFDVRVGDRFTLPETAPGLGGVSGVISEPPMDRGAYIRAPFRLEG